MTIKMMVSLDTAIFIVPEEQFPANQQQEQEIMIVDVEKSSNVEIVWKDTGNDEDAPFEQENEDEVYEYKKYPPCFTHSKKWLSGPRNSNANETDMSEKLIQSIILDGRPIDTDNGSFHVLDQTMCFPNGRFEAWDELSVLDKDETNDTNSDYLKYLAQRLMYLVIHENQHRPAMNEAMVRRRRANKEEYCVRDGEKVQMKIPLEELPSDVGKYDYECDPDTKYIVADLGHGNGMGRIIQTSAPESIWFGVASKRVVLWNNERKSNFFSCPRRDWQCLFLPMSPCVLTEDDLKNATRLSDYDVKEFRKTGKLPEKYKDVRVIKVRTNNSRSEMQGLREIFVSRIRSLYEENEKQVRVGTDTSGIQHPWLLDADTIRRVCNYILDMSNGYHVWKMWAAPLQYMLRPNMLLRREMNKAIEKSVPPDFDPNRSIGIPIRGK